MFAKDIHYFDDIPATLTDEKNVANMREMILDGHSFIGRKFMTEDRIAAIRRYLEGIGSSSLPNYHPVETGCPNFHRIDRWDPRAHVRACVHSFSFFPWNHDVFGLFDVFKPIYQLKNLLSGIPADSFLGPEPEKGCTARMSFQYYPSGMGGLNKHEDPFNYHQSTVPVMIMSQKGKDFTVGGSYVEREGGELFMLDDVCDAGDVIFFNAQCNHGVEKIDPDEEVDWLSQKGRWIALFAVNKVSGNTDIEDSTDLG